MVAVSITKVVSILLTVFWTRILFQNVTAHIYSVKNIIVITFTINKSDLQIILHTKGKLRFLLIVLPQIKCDKN